MPLLFVIFKHIDCSSLSHIPLVLTPAGCTPSEGRKRHGDKANPSITTGTGESLISALLCFFTAIGIVITESL